MNFVGHQSNWQHLTREIKESKAAHAYLLYGPSGIGKFLFAKTLASWIVCQNKENDQICGTCGTCLTAAKGQHPDIKIVTPEGKSLSVETIRDILKSLTRASLNSPCKVIIINEAHVMTPSAANSLLKNLEEPRPDTLFLLISPSLSSLLPTIRSRLRLMPFLPPAIAEGTPILSKLLDIPEAQAQRYLSLAEGSLGRALVLADGAYAALSDKLKEILNRRNPVFKDSVTFADELAKSDAEPRLVLELLKRDLLIQIRETGDLSGIAKIDRIERAAAELKRNINKQLVIENLLDDLAPGS